MKYQDYYKILGVERNADAATIKKAYRKLARKFHPDRSNEANAEERFKEINEAYEVLKDTEKRKAYDQFGDNWKHGQDFNAGGFGGAAGGFSGADFSDFFESIFSQGGFSAGRGDFGNGARSRRARARKGEDQHLKLDITLEEAFYGGRKTIQLSRNEATASGIPTPTLKKLKVNIPQGVTSGKKIRLAGQGHASPDGGTAGDLILELNVLPHRWFRLDGKDITLRCPVTPWEAALGTRIKTPTLSGQIELKVAPGIQSGQKMRLKGKGLPGKPAGDMFVEILIHTPPADNDDSRDFYHRMQQQFDFNPREF